MNIKLPLLVVAIATLAFWRVIPHPPNVTPVMATALFCGCFFADKKIALLLPLLAMLLADSFIGFHYAMLFVYAGIALTVWAGMLFLNTRLGPIRVGVTCIACSILFFLLTNFGVWLLSDMYVKSPAGLLQSYVAGIPFYRNSVLGDLFFTGLLFGSYFLAKKVHLTARLA